MWGDGILLCGLMVVSGDLWFMYVWMTFLTYILRMTMMLATYIGIICRK